jgi:hypothetical protein
MNSPPVVHETVDHETIVVNLDTGSYYDLNESAGYIFALLASDSAVPELVSAAVARYGIEEAVAEAAVDELLTKFVGEELVVPAEDGRAPQSMPPAASAPAATRPYTPPVLNKYTDMQELLLLDPVHEVTEAGWPTKA